MNNDDFDLYENEEEQLNACIMKAEDEYEQMKDRVHDLYDENQELKKKLAKAEKDTEFWNKKYLEKCEIKVYIKKSDVNQWIGKYFPNKDLIDYDDMISCIEELDSEIERLNEKYEEREQQIEDNYKPIDPYEQYNVSESWFH